MGTARIQRCHHQGWLNARKALIALKLVFYESIFHFENPRTASSSSLQSLFTDDQRQRSIDLLSGAAFSGAGNGRRLLSFSNFTFRFVSLSPSRIISILPNLLINTFRMDFARHTRFPRFQPNILFHQFRHLAKIQMKPLQTFTNHCFFFFSFCR